MRRTRHTPDPLLRFEWGKGYRPVKPEEHTPDWMTDELGFDNSDRRQVARLKVGESCLLLDGPFGAELRITRID